MAEVRVLRVGCPMWAHRGWIGRFYPTGTPNGSELALYATWCNAVEGNTTFYGEPSEATVERWRDATSADFRFAFKLPRTITHEKRLRNVGTEVRALLDRIEPLGARVGPIQVQLPPTFGPDQVDSLLAFLRRLPRERSWVLELRHRGYFDATTARSRVDELCRERGIGRVILDTRPLYAAPAESPAALDERRNKPHLPVLLDAAGASPVVRVIGEDRIEGTMNGLLRWVPQLAAWLDDGRSPYVFVHQPENLDSPELARGLHEAVAAAVDGLRPLPDPAGQRSLF